MIVQDIKKVEKAFDKPKPYKRWFWIGALGIIVFLLSAIGAMAQKIPLYQTINGLNIRDKYSYDIQSTYEVDNHIEIILRVYNEEAQQYAFGKNGEYEFEHLLIYNQPEYIALPTFSTFPSPVPWSDEDVRMQDKQYAPAEAVLQTIDRVMDIKQYKFLDRPINFGTVANTTHVIYSDADPETDTVDGYVGGYGNDSWSYVRQNIPDTPWNNTDGNYLYASAFVRADTQNQMTRSILGFDTSVVGSGTVDSAVLTFYPDYVDDTNDGDLTLEIADPATFTTIVNQDWEDAFNNTPTEIGTSRYDISDIVINNYANATITPAYIVTDDVTNVGMRVDYDFDDSAPVGGATADDLRFYSADYGVNTPFLTLEVSGAATTSTSTATTTLTALGSATSTLEQTQRNIVSAFYMFFVAGFFMVYLLMRTNNRD